MSMEKPFKRESGIINIVNVCDEDKKDVLDYFKKKFETDLSELRDVFIEKPEELKDIIFHINNYLQEFLGKYSTNLINISEKNINIVNKEKITDIERQKIEKEESSGAFIPEVQSIFMYKDYCEGDKLLFLQTMVHEMIHMNSFQSLQKTNEDDMGVCLIDKESNEKLFLRTRRVGLEIISSDRNAFFADLNEAITTELTIRFDKEYFSQIDAIKEIDEYKKREDTIKGMLEKQKMKPEDAKEVAYWTTTKEGDRYKSVLKDYSYRKERKKLWKVINNIYEKNKDNFNNEEEVFSLFARAAINGDLLPLARVVRKTYGMEVFKDIREEYKKDN